VNVSVHTRGGPHSLDSRRPSIRCSVTGLWPARLLARVSRDLSRSLPQGDSPANGSSATDFLSGGLRESPGWSLTCASRPGFDPRRKPSPHPGISGLRLIVGWSGLTASGCRSRAARQVTPERRRGRHAPGRVRASRSVGHGRERSAAVLLYAGEAILAFARLRTSGSKWAGSCRRRSHGWAPVR